MRTDTALPIDPLAATVGGRYEDELVVVTRWTGTWPRRGRGSVRTTHFDISSHDHRLVVTHAVAPDHLDDDLAGLIVDELFGPGWVRGPEMFERIFTGVVRTSAADPLESWELFYRNTIRRLAHESEAPVDHPAAGRALPVHGAIAGYAPVYDRAVSLVPRGSVLELGCCFGFLSLRLAAAGHHTTASDVAAGTVRLLAAVAPRLGVSLECVLADAARVPVVDGFADTVLVIHLLEHLDAEHGAKVVAEALRCARRRVVIAVPLEEEVDDSYGHVRTVSLADLAAWGRGVGLPHRVDEHHGGWLVIDKPHPGPVAGVR